MYRREENQDVVISLEMGTESEEGSQPKLCYRAGDETWRNAERGENLKLACLITWREWLVSSQEVEVGGYDFKK